MLRKLTEFNKKHFKVFRIMKTLSKYTSALIIGCAVIFILLAFLIEDRNALPASETPQSPVFPELLVRNDGIKQVPEWESHVHRVSALSARLIADPNDAEALVEMGQMYCIEARVTGEHGYYFPAILNMLGTALAVPGIEDKVRFEATVLKANVLLSQHRWVEGLEWAQKAHELNPYSAQVYAALIDAHVELGHYEKAVELTDELMQFRPGLTAYARASYLRELYGDVDGAIDAMKMAVEAGYPGMEDTEWCRVQLGELYEENGDLESAANIYRMSMQYRTENPFAMAGLGRILMQQGSYAEAENVLRTALTAVPEIGFQEDLFALYETWGKANEAREAYSGIIEMIEDDAAHGHEVDLDYAVILFEHGNDPDAALQRAMREYKIRPENIAVNSILARIYATKGEIDLARTHLNNALRTGYSDRALESLRNTLG